MTRPHVRRRSTSQVLFAFFIAAAAAMCTAGSARAVLLAYEGFDYTPGQLLITGGVGLNGGTGFAGAWDETQGSNFSTRIEAGSLGYVDGLGNALQTSGGKLNNTGETGTSQPGRSFAFRRDGTGATASTPVSTWFSFLGARQGQLNDTVAGSIENFTYGRGANLSLFDSTLPEPGDREKLNFGENSGFQFPLVQGSDLLRIQREDPSQIDLWAQTYGKSGVLAQSAVDYWQFNAPRANGNITAQGAPQYEDPDDGLITTARQWQQNPVDGRFRSRFSRTPFAGQASLMVARIDHFGGANPRDRVLIWMNPLLNAVPADSAADVVLDLSEIELRAMDQFIDPPFLGTEGNLFSFDRLRLFAGDASGGGGARKFAELLLDELRVGTTFASVTPHTGPPAAGNVPEPATLSLAGLVAVFVAARRRRTR